SSISAFTLSLHALFRSLTVGPTEGITSVFGSLIKQVKGDGMEMAVKEAGPLSLQLSEDEDVAVYWLRIVGPGNQSNSMIKSDARSEEHTSELQSRENLV